MEDVTIGDEMSLNDHRVIPGDHGVCLWTNSDRRSKTNGRPASGLQANNMRGKLSIISASVSSSLSNIDIVESIVESGHNQYKLLVNSER